VSKQAEALKNKMKKNSSRQAREELMTRITQQQPQEENTNVNVNTKKKKMKFEDRFSRATFYIQNEILEKLNEEAGEEKGEKTRIINDALKQHFNM
jgi:hypothetical protein